MPRSLVTLLLAALIVAPAAVLAPAATPSAHAESQLNLDAQGTLRFGTAPLVRVVPDDMAGYTIVDPHSGKVLGTISNYVDDHMFEVEAADGTIMGKYPGTTQLEAARAALRHMIELRKMAGVAAPRPGAAAATPAPAARAPEPEAEAPARSTITLGAVDKDGMTPVLAGGRKVARVHVSSGDWTLFDATKSELIGNIRKDGNTWRVTDGRERTVGTAPLSTPVASVFGQYVGALVGSAAPPKAPRRLARKRVDNPAQLKAVSIDKGWRFERLGEPYGSVVKQYATTWVVTEGSQRLGTLEESGSGWSIKDNHGDPIGHVKSNGELRCPNGRTVRLGRDATPADIVPHAFFGPDAE